jgi:hypothetical protein
VGVVGVKHGDIGGGTTETFRMSDGTGVASRMAKPTEANRNCGGSG